MTRTRALDHGAGREALLKATVHIVARRGLRGLTFRAVAEQASVNNTLIAHHFGSRDNLLAATLEWSAKKSIGAADLSAYANDAGTYLAALVENVLSEPDIQVFQYEMILESSRRPELRPAIHELYGRYVSALGAGWSRVGGGAEEDLVTAMFAAMDGLMLQYLSGTLSAERLTNAIGALHDTLTQQKLPLRPQP